MCNIVVFLLVNVTFIPLTSTTNKTPLTLTTPRIPIITNQSTTGIPMITNQTTPEIPRTTANQTTTTTNCMPIITVCKILAPYAVPKHFL